MKTQEFVRAVQELGYGIKKIYLDESCDEETAYFEIVGEQLVIALVDICQYNIALDFDPHRHTTLSKLINLYWTTAISKREAGRQSSCLRQVGE